MKMIGFRSMVKLAPSFPFIRLHVLQLRPHPMSSRLLHDGQDGPADSSAPPRDGLRGAGALA